jgi:hypothetical protein
VLTFVSSPTGGEASRRARALKAAASRTVHLYVVLSSAGGERGVQSSGAPPRRLKTISPDFANLVFSCGRKDFQLQRRVSHEGITDERFPPPSLRARLSLRRCSRSARTTRCATPRPSSVRPPRIERAQCRFFSWHPTTLKRPTATHSWVSFCDFGIHRVHKTRQTHHAAGTNPTKLYVCITTTTTPLPARCPSPSSPLFFPPANHRTTAAPTIVPPTPHRAGCDGRVWTWKEYYSDTIVAAKSFIALGLGGEGRTSRTQLAPRLETARLQPLSLPLDPP